MESLRKQTRKKRNYQSQRLNNFNEARPRKGSAIGAVTPEREKRQAAVDSIDALNRSRKAQLEKVARLSQAIRIKTNGTRRQGPAEGSNAAQRKLSFVAGA
jgi:hypothetical protein